MDLLGLFVSPKLLKFLATDTLSFQWSFMRGLNSKNSILLIWYLKSYYLNNIHTDCETKKMIIWFKRKERQQSGTVLLLMLVIVLSNNKISINYYLILLNINYDT